MEKYRDRCHCLLLYPEDDTHMNALDIIERSYDYAYILHDADFTEDGEIKKPHYHVVLRFPNARYSTAICDELGITYNYIEKAKNFKNALLYLIHFNDPDKAQYTTDDVKGTLKSRLIEEISNAGKTESEKVIELFDYIDACDTHISMNQFARYCASIGYWSEFRRSSFIFSQLLNEHNLKFRTTEEAC